MGVDTPFLNLGAACGKGLRYCKGMIPGKAEKAVCWGEGPERRVLWLRCISRPVARYTESLPIDDPPRARLWLALPFLDGTARCRMDEIG